MGMAGRPQQAAGFPDGGEVDASSLGGAVTCRGGGRWAKERKEETYVAKTNLSGQREREGNRPR
jgi:hypothetical protein